MPPLAVYPGHPVHLTVHPGPDVDATLAVDILPRIVGGRRELGRRPDVRHAQKRTQLAIETSRKKKIIMMSQGIVARPIG